MPGCRAPRLGAGAHGRSKDGKYWYLFSRPPELTNKQLKQSAITAETDPNTGQPEVLLSFTPSGSRAFQRITRAEYERGRQVAGLHGSAGTLKQQYTQHSAIVLDGVLETTPYIDYTDAVLSAGIAGGQAITILPSRRDAQNLALILRSGPLPYLLKVARSGGCSP